MGTLNLIKMIFLGYFFLLLEASGAEKCTQSRIDAIKKAARIQAAQVSQRFPHSSMFSSLESLENVLSACALDIYQIDLDPKTLSQIEEGYSRSLQTALSQMEILPFTSIPEMKNRYVRYAAQSGPHRKKAEAHLRRIQSKLQQIQEDEQKQCGKDVDLRGPKLGPMRDQGNTGWCFGHGVAELLSYRLGVQISGADVAMTFHENPVGATLSKLGLDMQPYGALPNVAMDRALEKGLCLESKFDSNQLEKSLLSTVKSYRGWKKYYDENKKNCVHCKQLWNENLRLVFPEIQRSQIEKLVEKFSSDETVLQELREVSCSPRIHPHPPIKPHSKTALTASGREELFSEIRTQLDQDNILAVLFDGRILDQGGDRFPKPWDYHVAIVAGKRINPASGQCEYLLKNFWGAKCDPYLDPIKRQCSDGMSWIPRRSFEQSLSQVLYLEK